MLGRKIAKVVGFLLASSIFLACIWYLFERFQWRGAFTQLLNTDFVKLIALVWAAQLAYICVRTLRWLVIVRHTNPEVGFFDLYWITAVVVSLAILTPGQVGEALKIELLKRRGLLGRLPGLGAFVLERILDVLVIAGMGVVGLVFGSGLSARYPGLKTAAGILFALGLAALYMLLRFDPGGRASPWLERMRTGSGSFSTWIKMTILTVLSWSLVGIAWQVSFLAVDIHLSLPQILWLMSLVTLGTLLSLIPGGLGVADVLTLEALVNMGVNQGTAQVGTLILRVYVLIIVLFGAGHLLLLLIWRLPLRLRCRDSTD